MCSKLVERYEIRMYMQTVSEASNLILMHPFCRFVTNSAYGFTLRKMVCMAFVQHPDTIRGIQTSIDQRWLSDRTAKWTINIAGKMVSWLVQFCLSTFK